MFLPTGNINQMINLKGMAMEILRQYLKTLKPAEKIDFAARCGTSLNYLRKAISKGQIIGPELCVQIEKESSGIVSRQKLNPDKWAQIWPELEANDQA